MKKPNADDPKSVFEKTGEIASHPIIIIGFYLGSILLTIAISEFQGFNQRNFIIAALVMFVLILIAVSVSSLFQHKTSEQRLKDNFLLMEKFIDSQRLGWIVNQQYVRSIEAGSKEVWVFTQALKNDLDPNGEIFKAVRQNLRSGSRYTYFVPEEPLVYDRIEKYNRLHKTKPGQIEFIIVPASQFCFYTDVYVYDVNTDHREAIEALPNDILDHYIKMDAEATDQVVGCGRLFIKQSSQAASGVSSTGSELGGSHQEANG